MILTGDYRTIRFDDSDLELVQKHNWHMVLKDGVAYAYANISVNGKRTKLAMHRLISGVTDPKLIVDHIDGNGLNNCRSNLRIVDASQSATNRTSMRGTSKFKGVSFVARTGKWRAAIHSRGKTTFLGYFSSENAAAKAYNKASIEIHGEFRRVETVFQSAGCQPSKRKTPGLTSRRSL
jgi:hypothetical protein